MTQTDHVAQLLLHSVSKPTANAEGGTDMVYDPEQLKYRLMSVHAPNFVAFIRRYKDLQTICRRIEETQLPGVGAALAEYFRDRAENMMLSVTGEGSHDAETIRLLLQDRKEIAYLESAPKSPGMLDRIAGATQQPQEQAPPQ